MPVSIRTYALHIKSKESNIFAFDKVYVMKEKDREYIPRFFPAAFVLKPSNFLRVALGSFDMAKATTHGHIRQDHQENCFDPPKPARELDDFEEDELIVIAVHTSNKGGTLRPTYMTSKTVRTKMNRYQAWARTKPKHRSKYNHNIPGVETHKENLGNLELQIGGQNASPCTLCKKGMGKFLNPDSCSLGSQDCLDNITTGTAPNTNRH